MSKATEAIELEITQQTERRELVKRYLLQGTMIPGTTIFAAHNARVESLGYEIAGLRRALAVVKRAEAVPDLAANLRASIDTAKARRTGKAEA